MYLLLAGGIFMHIRTYIQAGTTETLQTQEDTTEIRQTPLTSALLYQRYLGGVCLIC